MPAKSLQVVKPKRKLSEWQKFVKKHMGTKEIQALPFKERMKHISVMWKGPNAK